MNRRFVYALAGCAGLLGAMLASFQTPFAQASFAFGVFEAKRGVVDLFPLPLLDQEGQLAPLVAPGKFGAEALLAEQQGRQVEIRTSVIRRGTHEMWEVAKVMRVAGGEVRQAVRWVVEGGPIILHGEIVDSKCWLGVMQPGAGRVHRECAFRCLRGGVPTMFIARDGAAYWMVDSGYGQLDAKFAAEYAGLRVRLRGNLVRRSNLRCFAVDATSAVRE